MKRETIKLTTGYTRMATVLIFHQYYRNLICRDLDIRPTAQTGQLLRDYGILMKTHPNGFSLASDRSRDYNHSVFDGVLPLEFSIRVTNPLFVNFTDIPYTSDLHFDLRKTADPSHPYLHEGEFVGPQNYTEEGAEGITGRLLLEMNTDNDWFGVGAEEKNLKAESNFLITFRSRMSVWHYIFPEKEGDKRKISISPRQGLQKSSSSLASYSPQFIGPSRGETRQGRSVVEFRTSEPLPFRDRWDDWMEADVETAEGSPRKKVLSHARPEYLRFDETLNTFMTSIFESL